MEFISGRTALRRLELIPSCPVVLLAFRFFYKLIDFNRRCQRERNIVLDMLKDLSGEVKLGSGGGILSPRGRKIFKVRGVS